MPIDWKDAITAFLHDPPDKALDIRTHVSRTAAALEVALDEDVSGQHIKGVASLADQIAANIERLPHPKPGPDYRLAVGPEDGFLDVVHPLSGLPTRLSGCLLEPDEVRNAVRDVIAGLDEPRLRLLALWRWLPDRLIARRPIYSRLPAETRQPDHTIWHHADVALALHAATSGTGGRALLSFQLGPVQPFIEAARTVRDLWSGSAILSWLAFHAMKPVLDELGPSAFVFPQLRGLPVIDLWLREAGLSIKPRWPTSGAPVLSLPHKFVALVPFDEGKALADRCESSALEAWLSLAREVKREIGGKLDGIAHAADWDARWSEQIESFFSVRTSLLHIPRMDDALMAELLGEKSFDDAFPDAAQARRLVGLMPTADRPGYLNEDQGRWQAQLEISARLLASERRISPVPQLAASAPAPGKCSLLGTYEQMGPTGFEASSDFWDKARTRVAVDGVRLRKRERLCAISLAKRFAAPVVLVKALGVSAPDLRFPDTATVAARDWMKEAELDVDHLRSLGNGAWSGQWLYWSKREQEDDDPVPEGMWHEIQDARKRMRGDDQSDRPPAYYAIVRGDGDHMGRWLRGEEAPKLRAVYHPKLVEYFSRLPGGEECLDTRRPVGPALHAAISEALSNFAVHVVPDLVARHYGTLIYAGGDDFLALVPARRALALARALRLAFSGDAEDNGGADAGFYRLGGTNPSARHDLLMMGPKASISVGVAVVHFKEDLRDALSIAQKAEQDAKEKGRDALILSACRRSGEHATTLVARGRNDHGRLWGDLTFVEDLIAAFEKGASPGWAYRLRQQSQLLDRLPPDAARAELRRLVNRTETDTRRLLGEGDPKRAAACIEAALDRYRAMHPVAEETSGDGVIERFAMLCQSAFFLATGHDDGGRA